MNWLRAHWSRLAAGTAILAVAAVAGIVSYTHIYGETLALHQPRTDARLMPFGVDGLMVIGSIVLLQSPHGRGRLGWLAIGPGVAISLFANVMSGVRYGPQSATWAGIPAIAFFVACFVLENWLKDQGEPVPVTVPEAESVTVTAAVPVTVPEVTAVTVPAQRSKRAPSVAPEAVFADEIGRGELPSIRQIKARARVGTDRARVIRGELATIVQAAA